jgi:hypothetical protein
MKKNPPVCDVMCGTCPFRAGADLAPMLAQSALNQASRICHSTGANNAIHHRTGKPARLCRGARDVQLGAFHAMGFIAAPTDAAWDNKREELGC